MGSENDGCRGTVYARLAACRDEKYGEFQRKLVPNIDPGSILGVRTPQLRSLAKELSGTGEAEAFLRCLPHSCYEENLLHFFLISMLRDFNTCLFEVDRFLPYVDCWPVCDQSSPRVFAKHHAELLPAIRRWISSPHLYTARFGIRMLMKEYLGADFRPEYLAWVAGVKGEEYYLRMMVAWYFATALAKQYDAAIPYLRERRLDAWTHRMTIRKATESFRVSEEHKAYLRTLRD